MALSQVFKDSLAVPGSTYAMWLEIEGLDFAWGTAGGLDASAFLHRAARFRRTAAKAVLARQPAGVEQEARPLEGGSTIGSLLAELVDDGTSDAMALVANTSRTDKLLVSQVEKEWAPSTVYAVGDLVRPRVSSTATGNKHWFRCTTAGTSTATEPAWPVSVKGFTITVADGVALVWTAMGPQDVPADFEDAKIPYAGTADATAYPTSGGIVYYGRETLKYAARTTAPNGGGFFDVCKRGWFELDGRVQAHAHTVGDLVSSYPRFVATRRARLYLAPSQITNIVLRSQEFDDAVWAKTNTTVTANSWTAPDGTTTGDTLNDNATNGEHYIQQTVPMEAGRVVSASVFLKPGTIARGRLRVGNANNVDFNLTAKTVTLNAGTSAALDDLGDGSFRLRFTLTVQAGADLTDKWRLYMQDAAGNFVYVGGTGTLFVWGAQLRYGDVAGRYVATTTGPSSAANDAGAAIARYTGVIRRPSMARGLAAVRLEMESSEVELRVTAMGNRRSFKLAAGVETGDFVNKDSASVTDLTTYDRPDEQAPLHTTSNLLIDVASLSGEPLRDEEMGFTRTWRVGDEYMQAHAHLPNSGIHFDDSFKNMIGQRGYFSSRIEQHDPGDEVLEVLPLGAPPRFEEFFFDGAARTKIDFKSDGTSFTATILAPTAASANRFRTAAAFAQAVKDALYAAWPNTGTNFWTVSFDSAGRTTIGYTDATNHRIEFLWRTGANSAVTVSARDLLGFPKRDVAISTTTQVATSPEPAGAFHFAEDPGHPLEIVLRLLLSRGDGKNGTYDVLPKGFGAGVDAARVDVAGIEALRDFWMPEAQHFEVVDEPFVVKDKIASILRSHGCYLASLVDDKLTVRRMNPPIPGTALRAIDGTAVLEPPEWEVDPARAIGRIIFNCDHDPGNSSTELGPWRQRFRSELQGPGIEVQEHYAGIFQTHEVEAPGQWTGNNLLFGGRFGPNIGTGAAETARRTFEVLRDRCARPMPEIRAAAAYDLLDVDAGDLASVTLAQVPDASTGARGLSADVFEVKSRSVEDERGVVHLVLGQTAYGDRMRLLSPTGKVTTTQTSTVIQLGSAFAPPGVANEASQFAVGDWIHLYDPTLKTQKMGAQITAVGATSITTAVSVSQVAGDIVLLQPISAPQPAARQARSAFLADASPQAKLGGGAPHVYAS